MKLLNMLISAFNEIDGTAPEYRAAVYGNGRLGAISPADMYKQYQTRTQFKMPSIWGTAKKVISAPFKKFQERQSAKKKTRGTYPSLPVTILPRSRSRNRR